MLVLPFFVIFYVCFRNDLASLISPEALCTLLLCLPEEIFLQGGVRSGFSVVTAELLSQAPPGLGQPAATSLGGVTGAS